MIQSVIVDGKAIHFQQKAAGANDFSNEYRIDSLPRIMTVYFSGRIRPEDFPKTISTMNMMTSEVVELTDVIDWFPRMKTSGPFTYVLQAEAPSKFGLITNGSNINETESKGWRRITAQSLKPGYGISLLGSPGLKKSSLESDGYSIEIFYNKLPGSYVDSMKVDLLKTLQFYHQLYGSPGAHHLVRIIYSPRPAGGYARGSIIVVSEKYAVEQRLLKYGYARDFRLNAHEIAHFWSKANTSTPDDWINEGFAEFSALLATEKFVGNSFADVLTDEYRGIVENTKTQTAIVETSNDSWEREVNRYYKPALMFIEMRKKYGDEKLKQFFTDLCTRCDEGRSATTELILDVVEKNLGSEAKDYLNETLHRKVWNINSSEKKSVSVVDSTLIGTWSGPLTQFGATTKFVLHIAVKDGIVVPTLDSPDQNAFGIALSDFLQNNASISFKLGIASAVFHGIVDRNTKIITGVWTQRGVDYTLNLSKQ
ncbi:MAG TPA: hypothetical protein VK470_10205 [Bacteroidota bacterium]|nr:hypothetical protein [Bacteroidota bacterium]